MNKIMDKETIDLIKTSHFMPTIENDEIKSIGVVTSSTVISKEDDPYMNNTSILKPCPFCGADAHIWIRNNQEISYVRYMAAVECNNMYCEAMIDTQWFDTGDEAIQEAITCWNRRVDENV